MDNNVFKKDFANIFHFLHTVLHDYFGNISIYTFLWFEGEYGVLL